MFKDLLLFIYRKIFKSIAFYPSLMGFLSVVFALSILYTEYSQASQVLKDNMNFLLVTNVENARVILGTIVSGIIALMVFSFSMVMVVLNRASVTLSPRVIPGLISSRSHQIVLGFYISTIIFSLILIVNINHAQNEFNVPSLGILVSMVLAIICFGLFVYFIHSISQAIQIDTIVLSVFKDSEKDINNRLRSSIPINLNEQVQSQYWYDLSSSEDGYFRDISLNSLIRFLKKRDIILKVNVPRGFFLIKGYPYISVNKKLNKEEVQNIHEHVQIYNEEYVSDHYSFGFKQITEICLKALSPAINDIGTASKAMDMLTILFTKRMGILNEFEVDKSDNLRIIYSEKSFDLLLYETLGSIREYGSTDTRINIKLLAMLKNLLYADKDKIYQEQIFKEAEALIEEAKRNTDNSRDKEFLQNEITKFNEISDRKITLLNDI